MRSSNTYEERSLGIYAEDNQRPPDEAASNIITALKRRMTKIRDAPEESRAYFIRQQLRIQLAHDLWWLGIAVFLITIIETGQFERDPVVFSTFNIIFEIISAYGCVGISTGVPWNTYSFCGAWHTSSKLILCAIMLRGRRRGMPVAIDRAMLLPAESLARAEEEDANIRLERSMTRSRTFRSEQLISA
jgi:Trk-type K+ transport system membrane component